MNGMRVVLSGVAALFYGALALSSRAETWTLQHAVATALERNPDARMALARVAAAEAIVQQARAASLPHLALQGRYMGTDTPMLAFGAILNQRAFQPGMDFNRPGTIDNLAGSGNLSYMIYNGGQRSAQRAAALAGAAASEHELRAAHQQLAAEVVKAVLSIQKARDAVSAIAAGVQAYEAAVQAARLRFEAGQMLKADLLSLEVQLAQAREAHSSARHGAALAEQAFRFVLGLEASNEPVHFAAIDDTLARLVPPTERDFSQRPELLALDQRGRAAEAAMAGARGARRPAVNAFATYQYDYGYKLGRGGDSWLAGVSVDLNVFDGGATAARIRERNAELAQAREQLRKARLGIGLEVERARLAHAEAQERLAVAARTVAQAEESAALSRARFERESLLSADLIGVESRLVEARLRRTAAVADERIALIELRRALGLTPLPLGP